MDLVQTIILSIIEGITEFLPISSTGHLVLASSLLGIPQTEFVKSFEIIMQLGAILAVVVLYGKRLLVNSKILKRVIVAFIPTAIVGFTLYKIVKQFLIGNLGLTVAMLFLGGVLLIILEKIYKEQNHLGKIEDLSYKNAFLIGIIQTFSMVPGVSRAGATILGGMFLGLKRVTATEFSFLLAIPTMAAATGLDIIKSKAELTNSNLGLLAIGFLGSFITALFTVKFLVKFVSKNNFVPFGVYRIVVAILFWIFVIH